MAQLKFIYKAHLKTTHADQSAVQKKEATKNTYSRGNINVKYTAHTFKDITHIGTCQRKPHQENSNADR